MPPTKRNRVNCDFFQKKLRVLKITKKHSENDVHVSFQIGGNPRTIRWTTIGDMMNGDAMEMDAKISADPRMIDSMKKMQGVFVEGTIQDEMRVVFN